MIPARRPDRGVVERVAVAVATEHGVDLEKITLMAQTPAAVAARRECYRRVLDQTGCSVKGLAYVWGCDHQTIRKSLLAVAA